MNNYLNYPNYNYNYSKWKNNINSYDYNNYNQMNKKNDPLFDPYQGFIRGNMFKNLYEPYKLKEPYDIRPMNEQADILTKIDSLTFACVDLNLYLDVYPNDRDSIEQFNQIKIQKEQLIKEYESKFGPLLLNSDSLNTYPWAWIDKPWPWEN